MTREHFKNYRKNALLTVPNTIHCMQTLLCVALTERDMHFEEESTKQGTEHKLMVKQNWTIDI